MRTIISNLTRRFLVGTFMVLALAGNANAQMDLQGTAFKKVPKQRTTQKDTLKTRYTYEYNGQDYPVIINKKSGSCYIWGVKKDGKKTKVYIGSEKSAIVAKAYGIEYKPRNRK